MRILTVRAGGGKPLVVLSRLGSIALRSVWVVLVMSVAGCAAGPGGALSIGGGLGQKAADVPIPPGLEASIVATKTGEAGDRARMSLTALLETITIPDYLAVRAEDTGELPEPEEPPLAAQRAYMAARQAWLNRESFNAIRQLRSAQQLAPNSFEILRLLGTIYTRSGNRVHGAMFLEKAVAQNPRDVDSLFLLGRFAVSQGRWSDAIATLAHAVSIDREHDDPALIPLIEYYLGNALIQQGYELAAVEQLTSYLERSPKLNRTTRMVRELAVLSQQQGSTWTAVADAYHRLGRPRDALGAYNQALGGNWSYRSALVPRLVYTHLRLSQPRDAIRVVLEHVGQTRAGEDALRLVTYLSEQGVSRKRLARALLKVYDRGDNKSGIAVAVAGLLADRPARAFLNKHLDAYPADRASFELLIQKEVAAASESEPAHGAVAATARILTALPAASERYIAILLDAVGDPEDVSGGVQALPQATQASPIGRLISAVALGRLGRLDDAIDALTEVGAVTDSPSAARVALAGFLLDQREYSRAEDVLRGLLERSDPAVVRLRLRLLNETKRSDEAMVLLEELIKQQSENVEWPIEKASLQLMTGDLTGADETLSGALEAHPRSEALYEQLLSLYDSGRLPDAPRKYKALVSRMLSAIPRSRVARLEQGKLLEAAGRTSQAEPILRRLVDENADDAAALEALLGLLARSDRQDEAVDLLDGFLNGRDDDPQSLGMALRLYRRLEDDAKTAVTATRLIELLWPERVQHLTTLDRLFEIVVQGGDPIALSAWIDGRLADDAMDEAALRLAQRHFQRTHNAGRVYECTERLLMLQPEGVERAQALAILYLRHGNPNQAVGVLEPVLANADPDDPSVVVLMARALNDADRPDDADQLYERSIGQSPESAQALMFEWAMLVNARGDHPRSEALLSDLLQLNQDHPAANNALGYAWIDRGDRLNRAHEMIQRAVTADPDNAAYLDSMGWVLYKLGRFDESVTWLRRSRAAFGGEYPVILDHLGDALFRAGDIEQAAAIWHRAQTALQETEATALTDPELDGLAERLWAKISAVEAGEAPQVAPSPGPDHAPPEPAGTVDDPS